MQRTRLDFGTFQRSIASTGLAPDQARIMQNCELAFQQGRLRRSKGLALAQIEGSADTITSVGRFERRDCKKVLIDGSDAGALRITTGQVGKCRGPMCEWNDAPAPLDGALDESGFDLSTPYANSYAYIEARWTSSNPATYPAVTLQYDPNATDLAGVGYLDDGAGGRILRRQYDNEVLSAKLLLSPDLRSLRGYFGAGNEWSLDVAIDSGTLELVWSVRWLQAVSVNGTLRTIGDILSGTVAQTFEKD